jgi:hypothetical protein
MFMGSKARPVCKTDNLTAICEPNDYKMRDSRYLISLKASTACYGDSFTLFYFGQVYNRFNLQLPTMEL